MVQQPFDESFDNMHPHPRGFAMILSVLILAAVGVAISTTLLSVSISSAQTAGTSDESQSAKQMASACGEKALQQLISSPAYTGYGTLTVGGKGCGYMVSSIDVSNNTISASSTVGQTTRKLLIKVTVPQLVVMTWQEL